MSCNSAAKVVSDIWQEWDEEIIKLGCAGIAAYVQNPAIMMECLEKGNKANEAVQRMVSFWNRMVGNTWAQLGPRELVLNTNLQGTLQGTGGRMFVMQHPLRADKATVSIDERDGKAKTEVTICKAGPNASLTPVRTLWFNDEKADKRDQSEDRSVSLSDVKGYLLVVHLDAKSVTNKFAYTLRVDA
jgi:hypothetical protein